VAVIFSVIPAILALWPRTPRIPLISSLFVRKEKLKKPDDLIKIFFYEIANTYPDPLDEESDKDPGDSFCQEEVISKGLGSSMSDPWLKAISYDIVILSNNVRKKYWLIKISFITVVMADF
jgi:hypothetical protein